MIINSFIFVNKNSTVLYVHGNLKKSFKKLYLNFSF